jgi:hypothetical protein
MIQMYRDYAAKVQLVEGRPAFQGYWPDYYRESGAGVRGRIKTVQEETARVRQEFRDKLNKARMQLKAKKGEYELLKKEIDFVSTDILLNSSQAIQEAASTDRHFTPLIVLEGYLVG